MDPNLKMVLDELHRRFDVQDQKWESRFANLERAHAARDRAADLRVASLESTTANIESHCAELAKADIASRLSNLEAVYINHSDSV